MMMMTEVLKLTHSSAIHVLTSSREKISIQQFYSTNSPTTTTLLTDAYHLFSLFDTFCPNKIL